MEKDILAGRQPAGFRTISPEPPPRNGKPGEPKRPVGVGILSFLFIVGSLLGVAALILLVVMAITKGDEFLSGAPDGAVELMTLLGFFILAMLPLCLAAGIGLWEGKPYGWWIGTTFYMFNVVRNSFILVSFEPAEALEISPDYFYIKHGARLFIALLFLLYLFRKKVLSFFKMESVSRIRVAAKILGVSVLGYGAFGLTAYWMLHDKSLF